MRNLYPFYYIRKLTGGMVITAVCLLFNSLEATAQLAGEDCKFLGNIVAGNVPEGFEGYWNQITPENSGKWGSVESTRDVMSWTALDRAYEFAIDNGFPFKQHTFVWGNQQPGWISGLEATEQKEEVEEWIKQYSERYPETAYIDVVNEPLHAKPDYMNALGGTGETRYDWIVWSFEKAREYLPDAKLLINDYGILNSAANTRDYLDIIEVLQEKSLIDGIGVQAHGLESFGTITIKENLDKLAATGLPIYISEYEVDIVDDQHQLDIYKAQFPLFWNHSAVKGITLWGYIQDQIWKENAYLVKSNGSERPAMEWLKQYLSNTGLSACGEVPTGIEDFEKAGIKVYPNPVQNGRLTLSITHEITAINILGLDGQLVKNIAPSGSNILEANLQVPPGVYIVQMVSNKASVYSKIVVK